jgi:hypothetical protein
LRKVGARRTRGLAAIISQKRHTSLMDILGLISAGRATITVKGYPLLSIHSESRKVDLEVKGAKEAGLDLSKIIRLHEGSGNILSGSESVARRLSTLGWRLTLYDRGSAVLTMGYGVSRLTGQIRTNPLKLLKLLKALGSRATPS